MSKFDGVWQLVAQCPQTELTLTFDEVERAAGVPIDHSFLTYKKELLPYGWQVAKISMKRQTVHFERISPGE